MPKGRFMGLFFGVCPGLFPQERFDREPIGATLELASNRRQDRWRWLARLTKIGDQEETQYIVIPWR